MSSKQSQSEQTPFLHEGKCNTDPKCVFTKMESDPFHLQSPDPELDSKL